MFYVVYSYILYGMMCFGHNARARRDGKEKSGTMKSCVGTGNTQSVEGGFGEPPPYQVSRRLLRACEG
jgi:hypothetical protein